MPPVPSLLLLLATAQATPGAIGAVDDPLAPPALAPPPSPEIWHGGSVGPTEFQGVVALYAQDPVNTFCSGTLVDPEWVLTAAHCVADGEMQAWLADGLVHIGIGPSAPYVARATVDGATWHPRYDPSGPAGEGYDIALVHLARPVTTVTPIPYNTTPLDGSFLGLPVTIVGYGVTTDGGDDSGTKRRADTELVDLDGADLAYLFNGTISSSGQLRDDGTSNACQGDSGGASLARDGGGDWVLVGVTVVVFPQCARGAAGSTRTDVHDAWIQGVIGAGGGGGLDTPEVPDWFTLDATGAGSLDAPDLGAPPRPGDVAGYPTVDAPAEGTRGCATVDPVGLLGLTGLLASRRRRR